jgi:hypothetical protein
VGDALLRGIDFKCLSTPQAGKSRSKRCDLEMSKRKLWRQLDNTRIEGRAADNAERRRGEVGIGIGKLRMIECIKKLGAKLKATIFDRPFEGYRQLT